jgi:predicted  nucleic acid-binding Zn-ribbon protein
MRSLAAIRDDADRGRAQAELLDGHTPDMVKAKYAERPAPRDPRQALEQERERIERMIERLRKRLKEIEKRIEESGKE